MSVYDDLLLPENFFYAWKKAKSLTRTDDGYVDIVEVAEFELNLEAQLASIRDEFRQGTYNLAPLRPLPRPKKIDDNNAAISRQYFQVSIRDQVAWIAVVNALGPRLDSLMPPWSYGNRLYRAAWYEDVEDGRHSKLERGPYRHESGHLYRKFQHSWPLFRRHVSLTSRKMVETNTRKSADYDDAENRALEAARTDKLEYINREYWPSDKRKKGTQLFHAGVDLRQFYPNVRRKAVLSGLTSLPDFAFNSQLVALLEAMLDFRIDAEVLPPHLLENVDPSFFPDTRDGIPTGLFVAGFLSNAAMLPVDRKVNEIINQRRNIAHFRYVDDHVLLAYDFDDICSWIAEYQKILTDHGIGVQINDKKYDPPELGVYLRPSDGISNDKQQDLRKAAQAETIIDGASPTRLLTKTLAQVSAIAQVDIEVLDDDDLRERLQQLEWLLLADIPEREIRPDTRAAFAAGQIAALAGR